MQTICRTVKATIDKTCCSQQLSSHKGHSQNCNFKSNEPSSCGFEIVGAGLRKQLGNLWTSLPMIPNVGEMTAVGFEPTQLSLVELESTPLDHSGKLSMWAVFGEHAVCLLNGVGRESCPASRAGPKQPEALQQWRSA